ncbi:hypothetical protein NIB75_06495 [Bacteroides uniformis]|nr:hypothetical protein [Bacteroides uniformis]
MSKKQLRRRAYLLYRLRKQGIRCPDALPDHLLSLRGGSEISTVHPQPR